MKKVLKKIIKKNRELSDFASYLICVTSIMLTFIIAVIFNIHPYLIMIIIGLVMLLLEILELAHW